jgi:hypothetical protein
MSRTSRRAGTKSKKIPGSAANRGTQFQFPIGSKYHPRKKGKK